MAQTDEYLNQLFTDFYEKLDKQGINQSEAAEQLGITRSHLNKVINKKTDPSLKLIQNLERFCYGE